MKKSKKKFIIKFAVTLISAIIFSSLILCFIFFDNKNYVFEEIELNRNENIEQTTIKIAHLSDMHFPNIDIDLTAFLKDLSTKDIDFFAITGDLIDGSEIDSTGLIDFLTKLYNIAPIYYVTGNHEAKYADCEYLFSVLKKIGVIVLNNESAVFKKGAKEITVIGLKDNAKYNAKYISQQFDKNNYKILLAHRPDRNKNITYVASSSPETLQSVPNLVLTGHAHGGQIRMFNRGLFVPSQGFLPKYTSGAYEIGQKTTMIVSRGLGNSSFPWRINNPPHVPIITLYI
ncbi:MAG: metallophosphoesterase [Clostridia bacterium]